MRSLILPIFITLAIVIPENSLSQGRLKDPEKWNQLLRQGNTQEKKVALHKLAFILHFWTYKSNKKIFDPTLNTLKDKDPTLREAAAASLKWLGRLSKGCCKETQIVPSLIEALSDPVPHVRSEAAKALGYFKDLRAVDPLIQRIEDEDPWVSVNAVFSLGKLGNERALGPLLDLLRYEPNWRRKFVQQEAIIAIRKIGNRLSFIDKGGVAALMSATADNYLRAEAIKPLENIICHRPAKYSLRLRTIRMKISGH